MDCTNVTEHPNEDVKIEGDLETDSIANMKTDYLNTEAVFIKSEYDVLYEDIISESNSKDDNETNVASIADIDETNTKPNDITDTESTNVTEYPNEEDIISISNSEDDNESNVASIADIDETNTKPNDITDTESTNVTEYPNEDTISESNSEDDNESDIASIADIDETNTKPNDITDTESTNVTEYSNEEDIISISNSEDNNEYDVASIADIDETNIKPNDITVTESTNVTEYSNEEDIISISNSEDNNEYDVASIADIDETNIKPNDITVTESKNVTEYPNEEDIISISNSEDDNESDVASIADIDETNTKPNHNTVTESKNVTKYPNEDVKIEVDLETDIFNGIEDHFETSSANMETDILNTQETVTVKTEFQVLLEEIICEPSLEYYNDCEADDDQLSDKRNYSEPSKITDNGNIINENTKENVMIKVRKDLFCDNNMKHNLIIPPANSKATVKQELQGRESTYQNIVDYLRNKYNIDILEFSKDEQINRMEYRKKTLRALFKCNICWRGFNIKQDLIRHYISFHDDESGKEECDVCQCRFKSKALLQKHKMQHKWLYKCRECGKTTPHIGKAKQHFLWHNRQRNRPKIISKKICKDCGEELTESTKASTAEVQTITSRKRKKTNAQRCREYRERKKLKSTGVQTITSRKKTNAQKCREYRERKKLQNTMVQNITAERSNECSETDQLPAKKSKTDAKRRKRKKKYEAQKLKKQKSKKISKTDKQRKKECYDRKKKFQALNTLNHHSYVDKQNLTEHLRVKHPTSDQLVRCELCGECFLGLIGLTCHEKRIHFEMRSLKCRCSVCKTQFYSSKAFKAHRGTGKVCDTTRKYCVRCGESFDTEELLKEHEIEQRKPRTLIKRKVAISFDQKFYNRFGIRLNSQ